MAKKKSAYDDILFWKKDVDNGDDSSDNKEIGEIVKESIEKPTFNPTVRAYVPFQDEKTGKYEMFVVEIDPILNESKLNREPLKYDNYGRCVLDMQQRYAKDYTEKLNQLRRKK